jgi:hypothetical protein
VCRVDAIGANQYGYYISSGSAGAAPGSSVNAASQINFSVSGTTKLFLGGALPGLNTNVAYTGINPAQSGEVGVIVLQPN